MGVLRNRGDHDDQAPWAQPFGPPPASESAHFNPMVKTAAQLVGPAEPVESAPAARVAAA